MHGIYTAADNKQFSVVIGLDLSAAFFSTLLHNEFGVSEKALSWFQTYLTD
jgi:hypothetical protein